MKQETKTPQQTLKSNASSIESRVYIHVTIKPEKNEFEYYYTD